VRRGFRIKTAEDPRLAFGIKRPEDRLRRNGGSAAQRML
jgi:hypothetical protein